MVENYCAASGLSSKVSPLCTTFSSRSILGCLPGWARVGNVFGKPYQTLFCRFFVQFSVKTFCQSIVQLERTELTLNGGNVVNRFAVGILNVQTAQMVD